MSAAPSATPGPMAAEPRSEVQQRTDFSRIRYAQCWEDADLLCEGLSPTGRHCLSIGSAGDNSFALLAAGARSVTVAEMNPAQVACIELRKAGYLALDHPGLLQLLGLQPCEDRLALYQQCRGLMPETARAFWDHHESLAAGRPGPAHAGKFEHYFRLFRRCILPLAHPRRRVLALLQPRDPDQRRQFYHQQWNRHRWRWLFRLFFSRAAMGLLGRDPGLFKYVEGSVADRILDRVRHALVELDPSQNPYLRFILLGHHDGVLPMALRPQHHQSIREALQRPDSFHIHPGPIESVAPPADRRFDAFNLSDIFEYMNETNSEGLLRRLLAIAAPGARLMYWNMLVPRSRPESLADRLQPQIEQADALLRQDKAFFYSRVVLEVVAGGPDPDEPPEPAKPAAEPS